MQGRARTQAPVRISSSNRGSRLNTVSVEGARLTRPEKCRIAVEILATYVIVRWWLMRRRFPDVVAAARDVRYGSRDGSAVSMSGALRLGRVVGVALRPLPFDSRCLVRSLVLLRMLARRGVDVSLVIGVRPKPVFLAHAWIEREGVPLLPTGPEFERLSEF